MSASPAVVDELITLDEFARRYQVDTSLVRSWVKQGKIPYVLYGPKKLKRLRPADIEKVVTPIQPGGEVDPGPVVATANSASYQLIHPEPERNEWAGTDWDAMDKLIAGSGGLLPGDGLGQVLPEHSVAGRDGDSVVRANDDTASTANKEQADGYGRESSTRNPPPQLRGGGKGQTAGRNAKRS